MVKFHTTTTTKPYMKFLGLKKRQQIKLNHTHLVKSFQNQLQLNYKHVVEISFQDLHGNINPNICGSLSQDFMATVSFVICLDIKHQTAGSHKESL